MATQAASTLSTAAFVAQLHDHLRLGPHFKHAGVDAHVGVVGVSEAKLLGEVRVHVTPRLSLEPSASVQPPKHGWWRWGWPKIHRPADRRRNIQRQPIQRESCAAASGAYAPTFSAHQSSIAYINNLSVHIYIYIYICINIYVYTYLYTVTRSQKTLSQNTNKTLNKNTLTKLGSPLKYSVLSRPSLLRRHTSRRAAQQLCGC